MSTDHRWCPGPVYIIGGGKKIDVIPAEDDTRSDAMIEHAHRNIRSDIMSIFVGTISLQKVLIYNFRHSISHQKSMNRPKKVGSNFLMILSKHF